MDNKESKENHKSFNACPSLRRVDLQDDSHLKKYIMWENKSNICWLDASMALVAHNKVMKRYSGVSPESRISKIISSYDEVIAILNGSDKNISQKISLARAKLNYVQESTLQYLKPILKYKTGDPESAFCCLYNLLIQDSVIKQIFDVTWMSVKECTNCGVSKITKSKPVITLSKIDSFDPENPVVMYNCVCKRLDQKIKLVYVGLPPCLIFHFENGAGKEKPPLSFSTQGREYQLTGVMTLEKSQDSTVNHFITWVRNPFVDKWLDCNDLNLDIISFSPDFPDFNLKDVYIYVYESFDDMGTIKDSEMINTKNSDENIPCIDLSEESDTENSHSQTTVSESSKNTKKMAASGSNLKSVKDISTSLKQSDREESLEGATSASNDFSVDKKITQNLNNDCDKTSQGETGGSISEPVKMNNEKVPCEISETVNDILRIASDATVCVNMTLSKSDDSKTVNENISNLGCSQHNGRNDKLSSKGSHSISSIEQTERNRISHNTEDRPKNSEVRHKSVIKSEPFFNTEKEQNSHNKALLHQKVLDCSNTSDEKTEKPENLGCPKVRNVVPSTRFPKKNSTKESNNSEQLLTNTSELNNERLSSGLDAERQVDEDHFLSTALANSSGTSYVKLSVRRKKYPGHLAYKKDYMKNTSNLDYDETLYKDIDTPSCSKSMKRTRETKRKRNEDCDYVTFDVSKKKQQIKKISKTKEGVVITKDKTHHSKDLKTRLKSSQIKSQLNWASKKKIHDTNNSILNDDDNGQNNLEEDFKFFAERSCSQSGVASEDKNSNRKSDNDGKILKDFEDMWSCHEPDCNCDFASLEETIDIAVDFTFAYLCKLSQEYKKSSSH